MDEKIEKLLLKSFDAELTPQEQETLDKALAESDALRLEQEELRILRQTLSESANQSFKPFFAERTMNAIRLSEQNSPEESFFNALNSLFRPVAWAAIILIFAMLSINAFRNNGDLLANVFDTNQTDLEQIFDPTYEWLEE